MENEMDNKIYNYWFETVSGLQYFLHSQLFLK